MDLKQSTNDLRAARHTLDELERKLYVADGTDIPAINRLKTEVTSAAETVAEILARIQGQLRTPQSHAFPTEGSVTSVGTGAKLKASASTVDLRKLLDGVAPVRKSDGSFDSVASAVKMVLKVGGHPGVLAPGAAKFTNR